MKRAVNRRPSQGGRAGGHASTMPIVGSCCQESQNREQAHGCECPIFVLFVSFVVFSRQPVSSSLADASVLRIARIQPA